MRITSKEILNSPINPVLFRMSIPMVVGIFVLFTFQSVDTFFISLIGTRELAAISFTIPVIYTITNVAVGLGIGTSILIANVIGKGDSSSAVRTTSDSIFLTLVLGIVISVFGFLFSDPLFVLLGASDSTLILIHDYLDIWLLGTPIFLIPIIANGAIRATGDTKWPSILMICSGALNVILDPLLIFGIGPFPEMGLQGAALATVISGLLGAVVAGYILLIRENLFSFTWPGMQLLLFGWKAIVVMCLPIVVANTLTPILSGIITAFVSSYGEEAVAGFGVGTRYELLFMVAGFALTAALSPFMAQNMGAGQKPRAKKALYSSIKFLTAFYFVLWAIAYVCAPYLSRVFSSEPSVVAATVLYLRIMPAGFVVYGIFIVINTAFNSAQKSLLTMYVSLIRVFLCITPCAWFGSQYAGLPGLYWGVVAGGLLACVVSWFWVKRIYTD